MTRLVLTPFELAALFLGLISAVGLFNRRFVRAPSGAAMLLAGLGAGLLVRMVGAALPGAPDLGALFAKLDFRDALLGHMLAFLLFAGAMSVDFRVLRRNGLIVALLATLGVGASILLVGGGLYVVSALIGQPLGAGPAFVFAALISPTDPVAVLATVKGGALSPRLKAVLQGEALFNDGVGIVAFRAALALVFSHAAPTAASAAGAVLYQSLVGLLLGGAMGLGLSRLLRRVDDAPLAMAAGLACAGASYALAERLGVSGALSAAAAGLMAGAFGSGGAGRHGAEALGAFWTLIDEILNALLFFMVGLVALFAPFDFGAVVLSVLAFILTLAARFLTVAPLGVRLLKRGERGALVLLTLGGLRGGLSLALALSLGAAPGGGRLIAIAYGVVALSVVVQGLAFNPVAARTFENKY
jgi:CPA1 family monovalent cation:H+ antiporter